MTRKSAEGSVNEYRFVIHVSHDLSDPTVLLKRAAKVLAAVISVS
jgi:hypothetical protein